LASAGDAGRGRSIDRPQATALGLTAISAALVGIAVAVSPAIAFVTTMGLAVAGMLLTTGSARNGFLVALATLLAGYALLGRGLAHVGYPPMFVGETVLAVAVLAIIACYRRARFEPTIVVLVTFMTWGALRTIPYVSDYGIDALRDAVVWGYGLFAIAVWLVVERRDLEPLVRAYRRLIPVLLIWIPVATILAVSLGDAIPAGPGSDIPIVVIKAGDFGVHLAGVAAFVLVGLYAPPFNTARQLSEAVFWIAWSLNVALVAALSRGAMAAAGMVAVSVLFVRSYGRWLRATFALVFLAAIVGLANPVVDLGLERKISLEQIIANIGSVASDESDPILADSKEWRARWWETIVGYTFDGPYFWTGKGFGLNLADDDGFQVLDDGSLRAPHNGHLAFLARSGVPGLFLWVTLLVTFGVTVLRAIRRAGRMGDTKARGVLIVVLVYWLAAIVNAATDVYLEGPQGGILFWSVMGLGLAIAGYLRRTEQAQAAPTASTDD
jgi:hypothetical protein